MQRQSFEDDSGSNARATEVIVEAFRQCNKAKKGKADQQQSDLYSYLRRQLNPDLKRYVCYNEKDGTKDFLAQSYFAPAFAEKHW